jgi:hypothetical protein
VHVIRRSAAAVLLAAIGSVISGPGLALGVKLDQKTYVRVDDAKFGGRLYLFVDDIESTSSRPGFKPFEVDVLVGKYRAPLLGPKGFLRAQDLANLLKNRTDVWRDKLRIVNGSESKAFSPPGFPRFTIKVQQVLPAKSGTDSVMLDVF